MSQSVKKIFFISLVVIVIFWGIGPILGSIVVGGWFPFSYVGLPPAILASFIYLGAFLFFLVKTNYFHPPFDVVRSILFGLIVGLTCGLVGYFPGVFAGVVIGPIMTPCLVCYWLHEGHAEKKISVVRIATLLFLVFISIPFFIFSALTIRYPEFGKKIVVRLVTDPFFMWRKGWAWEKR